MAEKRYKVLVNDRVAAESMHMSTAVLLLSALFVEYGNDPSLIVSVKEMERCEACENG